MTSWIGRATLNLGTRIVVVAEAGGNRLALWSEDGLRLLPAACSRLGGLLELDDGAREEVLSQVGPATPAAGVRLAPLVDPGAAVWCLALNYESHLAEGGHQKPQHPVLFLRMPESFAEPDGALHKPEGSRQFDYEGELAVFIGQGGYRIAAAQARAHIGGYACCNEGSVREWQRHSTQITAGKNFFRSGSLGPWLRLSDTAFDPYPARLRTRVNGQEVQSAQVDEMGIRIDELIAYLSEVTPLRAGDILLMGTPGGVGVRRTPQLFLWPGDHVEVEIEGLGVLRNGVV